MYFFPFQAELIPKHTDQKATKLKEWSKMIRFKKKFQKENWKIRQKLKLIYLIHLQIDCLQFQSLKCKNDMFRSITPFS